jgi:hypothetical protein
LQNTLGFFIVRKKTGGSERAAGQEGVKRFRKKSGCCGYTGRCPAGHSLNAIPPERFRSGGDPKGGLFPEFRQIQEQSMKTRTPIITKLMPTNRNMDKNL